VSRKTITSKVMSEEYNRIKVDLKENLYVQHLTFSTDIWTDTYTLSLHHSVRLLGPLESAEPLPQQD